MKKKKEILIVRGIIEKMKRDSQKHPDDETGGCGFGIDGNNIGIVAISESGENSIHHAMRYTTDPVNDRKGLLEARKIFGNKIEPNFWWHKHPSGMDKPSSGDCIQARQLAQEYNDGKPILMGIVNLYKVKGRVKFSLKIYSLDKNGMPIEHLWRAVEASDPKLLAMIDAAPNRPEVINTEFWRDKNFQFYLNPIGRQRIQDEIQQLKQAGWNVVTSREKSSGIMIMDITGGLHEISFKLPPEYPLNPPEVIVHGIVDNWLNTVKNWSSIRTLSNIITEISEYHNECEKSSKTVQNISAKKIGKKTSRTRRRVIR